jgi:hypothetical protein
MKVSPSQIRRSGRPRHSPDGLLHRTDGSDLQKILHGSPAT